MPKKYSISSIVRFSVFLLVFAIFAFTLLTYAAAYPRKYKPIVKKYGALYGLDENLVYAVIKTESSFNAEAVSAKGAAGLMQILPSTAEYISIKWYNGEKYDLLNPETNVKYGCKYLAHLIEKFNGVEAGLAAYNAGEGKVAIWLADENYSDNGKTLKTIPYKETADYVQKVLKRRMIYSVLY